MPLNGFSTGRDVSIDIVGPNGPVRFNLVTKFNSKQKAKKEMIKGLDGIGRPVRFFQGWEGDFELERQDSQLDDYFAQIEANYYAGQNEATVSITETITEVNGAVTQYRYVGCLLTCDDAGDKTGEATIKQKISFEASRRVKVA